MNKAHSNVNWKNYPSSETPINEQNLNKMDNSIDEIDNRVIVLDGTKANKTEVAQLVKDISFDENTGIFVITKKDGSTFTIDTKMEKIAVNFTYDTELQQIILTLIDGTIERIDLSDFITQYEFLDTDTISFSTDNFGNVYAIVKEGSIEEKHLRPDYLADIKVEAAKANTSVINAARSEANAKESEEKAENSKISANNSAISAANSASTASGKAIEANTSATNALLSANTSTSKANEAADSAISAANSATTAIDSANTAIQKATAANTSAINAENYANQSKSYAVGAGSVRPNELTDNAKYYYEQSKNIYENFENLGNVTGVKGNKESIYRTGNVNLTTENIGAVNKAGDTMTGDLIVPNARSNTSNPTLPASGSLVLPAIMNLRYYRSFLGTYSKDGNSDWNYLINIRHRNGFGDGDLYGMYIKAPLSDSNKNLSWGFQHIEEWSKERIILDDVNYKNYCLMLSGGSMNNDANVTFKSDSPIGTQLQFKSGNYIVNIRPAELILSNGNKQIYIMQGNGINHPSIKLIDVDNTHEYDENVEISSSFIKITDNSSNENLQIDADSVKTKTTFAINTNNVNNHSLIVNGSTKSIYSGIAVSDEKYDLGTSNRNWKDIYATNGIIQTSDRTKKTNINSLETQKVQAFINGLNPVSYKMIDGTSGRTHYGFIAQDIEELMNTLNMDSSDFAGFIKSPKKIIKYEDENGKKLKKPIEEVVEGEYDYSLRYDEFIAPLIKVVQEQQKEIEKLKEDIDFLKQYIYQL